MFPDSDIFGGYMENYQKNIDRYRKVMRFGFGIYTLIWLCLMAAVIVYAADWQSALALLCILTVSYIWIYFRYRRNVRQAVEGYRRKYGETPNS